MDAKQLHMAAWGARSKLFDLITEIKSIQLSATWTEEIADDIGGLDTVACQLAAIHDALPDVFIAAAREN